MNDCRRPFANPLLTISAFDSDAAAPMVLCVVPSEDGVVRFSMPAVYVDLVNEFDGQRTVDEAIQAFMDKSNTSLSKEWLRRLVDKSLIPKGLLIYSHQDPTRAAVSSQPNRKYLYVKLPILKPGFVEPVARRLGFMFRRGALICGGALFIAMHVYVYGIVLQHHTVDFNNLSVINIIELMWLSTLGALLHEFGHASAAAHYGCRRMTIGWGLYFIYKVMWTDVSEAWKLARRQRVVVDIGGVYFESLHLLLMILLYLTTGNVLFIFAFIFSDWSIADNVNPFLRMDGYWLMSDLFGIVNLRAQQRLWAQRIAARLFGGGPTDVQLNLSRRARVALAVYTALGLLFFFYIAIVVVQTVVLSVAVKYPGLLQHVWTELHGRISFLDVLYSLVEIGWRTMLLLGVAVTVVRLLKSGIRLVVNLRIAHTAVQAT